MPIYMKIEGITGTATGKYKGWIELESAQMGVNRSQSSPTGRGVDRGSRLPSLSEIVVTKRHDLSSPQLFNLSLAGEGRKVTIEFVKTDAKTTETYLIIELENALISSYSVSGTSEPKPMESIALNFTKITYRTVQGSSDPKDARDRAVGNMAAGSKSSP